MSLQIVAGSVTDPLDDVPWPDAPDDGDPYGEDDEDQADREAASERVLAHEVEHEVRRLRVREEAARQLRAERGPVELPRPVLLSDFLAQPSPPSRWRLDGLMPAGARVVLAAAWKAGKTTLMGNLVRSLADGEPFLGRFDVVPTGRRVVLIDDELDEDMLREWLRAQGVRNTGAVAVLSLRGRVSTFDVFDVDSRARWATMLADLDPGVVLFDCLRPALDAFGLDESREVGRFLEPFDELLREAGADEAGLVHHMGHTGERSRGDSRLRDWPDVEWRLVREKPEDPASPRFFSAYGRDVEISESRLDYDPAARRLVLAGGSRKDAAADQVVPVLFDLLDAKRDGLSTRAIEDTLVDSDEVSRDPLRRALARGVSDGWITVAKGPKRANLHYLSRPNCASARECASSARARSCECASAPIEGAHSHTRSDPSSARVDQPTLDDPDDAGDSE